MSVNNTYLFSLMFVYIFTISEGFNLFLGGFSLRSPYSEIPDHSTAYVIKMLHHRCKSTN